MSPRAIRIALIMGLALLAVTLSEAQTVTRVAALVRSRLVPAIAADITRNK